MNQKSINQLDYLLDSGISLSTLVTGSIPTGLGMLLNKPICVNNGKRTILHSPEQIAKVIKVDEQGKLWWVERKGGRRLDKPASNINKDGYTTICFPGKVYLAHVLAWMLYYNEWPPEHLDIDHINGNKTDNRKDNLRLVSRSHNMLNSHRPSAASTSGYPGVSWSKSKQKWKAYIKINYKQIHGGYFATKEEAITARTKLELIYEGD